MSEVYFISKVEQLSYTSLYLLAYEQSVTLTYFRVGIFRLSERGMKEIGGCCKAGFHPHEDSAALFFYCHDVRFENSLTAVVVDLR